MALIRRRAAAADAEPCASAAFGRGLVLAGLERELVVVPEERRPLGVLVDDGSASGLPSGDRHHPGHERAGVHAALSPATGAGRRVAGPPADAEVRAVALAAGPGMFRAAP